MARQTSCGPAEVYSPSPLEQVPDDVPQIPEVVVFNWNKEDEDDTVRQSDGDGKVTHFVIRVIGSTRTSSGILRAHRHTALIGREESRDHAHWAVIGSH